MPWFAAFVYWKVVEFLGLFAVYAYGKIVEFGVLLTVLKLLDWSIEIGQAALELGKVKTGLQPGSFCPAAVVDGAESMGSLGKRPRRPRFILAVQILGGLGRKFPCSTQRVSSQLDADLDSPEQHRLRPKGVRSLP